MEQPQETWTQTMAHAVHDGPLQTVVSVTLELAGLARAVSSATPPGPDQINSTLERLRLANQQAVNELRAIVRQLSESSYGSGDEPPRTKAMPSGYEGLWRTDEMRARRERR